MSVELGKIYKTHGGWDAKVIWVTRGSLGCFVIHKPGDAQESFPVAHDAVTGKALPAFVVGGPPTYDGDQPADLIIPKQ